MSESKERSSSSKALLLAAVLVVAARLLSLLAVDSRVWGLDILRQLDAWWVVMFSVLPLIAALPAIEGHLSRLLEKRSIRWGRLSWLAVGLLFIAVILFPMDTFYYGDGGPLVSEIYKIGAQEHYSSEMLLNLKSAPLAGGLLHLLAVWIPAAMYSLGLTLPKTPLFPFLGASLLGILLLGFTLNFEKDPRNRLSLLLLLVGTAGGLFFFRYAEMYLPVFLLIAAYLLAAAAVLRGERPIWIAVLLYMLAVAAHYMALALLPSLLFLLLRKQPFVQKMTSSGRTLAISFGAVLVVVFAAYFAFGFQHSDSRVIMPLQQVEAAAGILSYTLFSSYHLLDMINLLLLLAPFPLMYLLFLAAGMNGKKQIGSRSNSRLSATSASEPAEGKPTVRHAAGQISEGLRFHLIAGYSFLLFLFFANTSLGLARDWDIAAPLGLVIIMLLFELRLGKNGARFRLSQPRLLQAGLVSMLFAVPWIAANVDDDASTARFASIMKLDDEHMYGDYALSGYEALRKQAVHAKDTDEERAILQRMIEIVGYTEQYRMLVSNALSYADAQPSRYFEIDDWILGRLGQKASELRTRGLEHDYTIGLKQIDSLAAVIAVESITFSQMQEMYPRILTFAEKSGCETAKNILLGTGWYLEEQFEKALPFFNAVRSAGFRDARVDGMYGCVLYVSGDSGMGEAEFQDGLQHYGKNPQYLFMVATSYLRRNEKIPQARTLLERARSLNPPAEALEQIDDILKQLH